MVFQNVRRNYKKNRKKNMLGIQLDKRKARTEGIRYKKGFACVIYLVFLYNKKNSYIINTGDPLKQVCM